MRNTYILVTRWLIRTSYAIPTRERCQCCDFCFDCEGCWDDCLTALCCPCCSVNQLYQTTSQQRPPIRPFEEAKGRQFNRLPFLVPHPRLELNTCCCDLVRSFFCTPCAIGDILHDTLSMPWYMACCTVHPCLMRSLYRYEHRIWGSDDLLEVGCCLLQCQQLYAPQPLQCFAWTLNSCMVLHILQDARARRGIPRPPPCPPPSAPITVALAAYELVPLTPSAPPLPKTHPRC
jgi:hypothetical protein